jgi:hypothetical protein
MVPSSVIAIIAGSERQTCSGFSVSETIRHASFEFIAD